MQDNKRVYRTGGFPSVWLNYLLLFLSAVVLISGLVWRGDGDEVDIAPLPTLTPIPTGEAFDETRESRDITLQGREWYALQLGVFENEDSADELAERFRARGAAGYVWGDGRFRVLAALYATKDDAQNVRRQLSENHTVDTYIYQIDLPATELRLSGMRGQLDIMEAAFAQAGDCIASLQALAISMDRQEAGVEDARMALEAIAVQCDNMRLRLRQRFPEPRHQTVEGLLACFDDYMLFTGGLGEGVSVVELTVYVKHQAIHALRLLGNVYEGLQAI